MTAPAGRWHRSSTGPAPGLLPDGAEASAIQRLHPLLPETPQTSCELVNKLQALGPQQVYIHPG